MKSPNKQERKEKKEKTYVFNKFRYACVIDDGAISQDELANGMIEDALSRGYIPAEITLRKIRANAMTKGGVLISNFFTFEEPKDYITAFCHVAYAGKKTAREIYEKNGVIKFPANILIISFSKHKNK